MFVLFDSMFALSCVPKGAAPEGAAPEGANPKGADDATGAAAATGVGALAASWAWILFRYSGNESAI